MNRKLKILLLIVLDLVAAVCAAACALYLTDIREGDTMPAFLILLGAMFFVFTVFGLYRSVWRYAGVMELIRIGFSFVCLAVVSLVLSLAYELPLRLFIADWILLLAAVTAIRFSYRLLCHVQNIYQRHKKAQGRRVIIIGAGAAGRTLVREIQTCDYISYTPVCFLDDDKNKIGLRVEGVTVYGAIDTVKEAADRFAAEEILIAMPSIPRIEMRRVLEICRTTGLRTRTLPGMYQLMNEQVRVSALRDVEIQDLLGRDQITVNLDEIMGYIEGKVVLVTGGGGSIGSELCRQIASHNPKQLLMLDIYENSLYDIEQELRRKHPELDQLALVASIRGSGKMEDVFRRYRPEVVFNAAAHKHVPLMETSPNEAVKNNVFGTLNMARMADRYGVRRFVQISTDKAVNPTNIMGATKRLCEMIIQAFSRRSKTEFVAVRFGNVLGSNGSVIPLFKQQITEGGPVTVTHKDIIRYFMTIPEAVSLVLQAGAYAKGGEIFVLDMGEPVRIYDLAENLIRLSGYEPGVDIEIRCTGLRPGEKLFEERLMAEEGLRTTPNGMISIARPILFDDEQFFKSLDKLYTAAYAENEQMKDMVAELVPTYKVDKK
ncbi:MAG: polysaccharide biosynthesis protein [Clostridia bacterium]|nr:polysaccharide biosynthesis protein [Clostridia bacterium]